MRTVFAVVSAACVLSVVVVVDRTSALAIDEAGCKSTKVCFRVPSGCVGVACEVLVSWAADGKGGVALEMQASGSDYVAMGFSDDTSMGDDYVVDCIYHNSKINVGRSYNDGQSNAELPVASAGKGISDEKGSKVDGNVFCSFTMQTTVANESKIVDLTKKHHVFLARGQIDSAGKKQQHSETPMASATTLDLSIPAGNGTGAPPAGDKPDYTLMKAHAGLMMGAWMLLAGTGMFIARFFKGAWPNKTMCGLKVWFPLHRIYMILTFACTVAGFVVVFVKKGEYSKLEGESNLSKAHPIIGIVVTILVIVNPIMSVFRCDPTDSKRPIFNYLHWFVGTSAHALGVLAIFIGIGMKASDGFAPDVLFWIMVGYVAFHVVMYLIMELHQCVSSRKDQKKVQAMEMQANGPTEVVYSTSSVWGVTFKYAMLIIYMAVTTTLYVVMAVLIGTKD